MIRSNSTRRGIVLATVICFALVSLCLTIAIIATTEKSHIHSITELNTEMHTIDSHDGVTDRSTLELDYRTMLLLTPDELGTGNAHYPRIKKLNDGSYILFYNTGRTYPDVYYKTSQDLVNWSEPTPFCVSDGTYYYATCDAIVLSNGDILACIAKRPVSWSNYVGNMDASTLITKRSTDNGKTWSEETTVYTGMVWEPSLLELDTGELQIYFTSTATYTALYGYNYDVRSSGSSIIRSFDGGYTWTPNVTGHNVDENDPYAAWRVMQQKIGKMTVTDPITGESFEEDWFNDQMPVAIQLNNGSIALVVESYLHFAEHPVNGGLYQLSIGFSYDNWATPLGRTQEGPADKLLNVDRAAGPYIRQFPSGEVIISHTNSTTKVEYKIADPTAHILSKDFSINSGTKNLWCSSEIIDGHRIAFVSDDGNSSADVEANTMDLGVFVMSLNHDITAYSQVTEFDGYSDDWSENTEAIFVGSMSQAQCSVRSSYDTDNVYFLIEVLDEYLSKSDSVELRFAANTTSTTYYKITANHSGLISKNFPYTVNTKIYKNGTVDNDSDTDVGYVIEIKLSKSDLAKIGFSDSLYILPIVYNTDGTTTYDYDSISGANIGDKARTLCPKVTYDGIRRYEKVFVSSNGNDDACGNSETSAVKTLERASQILKGKGEMILLDDIAFTTDLYLKTDAESITIKGRSSSVTLTGSANIFAESDIFIDDITIYSMASGKFIYMQYHDLYIGKNVTCQKISDTSTMYGIIAGFFAYNEKSTYAQLCSEKNCKIEINGGRWRYVRGGNRRYGTSAPLGHYSGNCTIIINDGIFEAKSTSLTDDVTSPTGMNSSSGNNVLIVNGGRFVGAIYAQSRSGGIVKTADGFTDTPDYSGSARIVYTAGVIEGGIFASQTIGYPDNNVYYPYNSQLTVTYLDSLSASIDTNGFTDLSSIGYEIPICFTPKSVELDGKSIDYHIYGDKLYLSSHAAGDILSIFGDEESASYLLNNEDLSYTDIGLSSWLPYYVGTAIRTQDSAGLRFKSLIDLSTVPRNVEILKVGSIACFKDSLSENDPLTFNNLKFGESVSFDSRAMTERWYEERDDGAKIFTAVLVNFNESEYRREITYRPYVTFGFEGKEYTAYGECVTRSIYYVSMQCTGIDSGYSFIQEIINKCEGQDIDIDHSFFD